MKQFNALVNNEPRLFNVSEDRESDFFSKYPDATLASPPSDDDIIPVSEKLKLNYAERKYLLRYNLEFTYKNVREAKAELERRANLPFNEKIQELKNDIIGDKKLNLQKYKNISYQLFGEDGFGGESGPLMKQRLEQAAFAYATALHEIYNDKDTAKRLKESQANLAKIEKEASLRPMPSVTDDDVDGLLGFLLGIGGDAIQVGTSVIPTVAAAYGGGLIGGSVGGGPGAVAGGIIGGATSIFSQIAPGFIVDYNVEKAKTLYPRMNEEEAFAKYVNNDQTELLIPLAGAAVATIPEYVGFKGISKFLFNSPVGKKIVGDLGRRAISSPAYVRGVKAALGEGGTETVQLFPEAYNIALARGKSIEDAAIEAFDFTYDNSTKTFLSAFTGTLAFGGLAKGAGSITKKAWKSSKNMRVAIDQQKMEAVIDEIAVLNEKRIEANSNELKEAIDEQIKEKVNELESLVVRTASIFNFAEDKDFDQIDNLEDLKKKYIDKVKNIQKERDNLDPVEYKNALELYKQKYLAAQAKIKGVVTEVSDKSNKQAQEVNKIFENEVLNETNPEKQQAGIGKIVELYRGMARRLALKRKNAPNFDLDLLTDEILTGKRGILDLINSYQKYVTKQQKENKPVAPLSGYINTNVARRAIESSNRVLGDEFTEDVTTQKKVAQPETTEDIIENQATEIQKQLADKLNLKEEFKKLISDSAKKILGTRLPAISSKDFKSQIVKSLRDDLFKLFKKDVFQVDRTYKDFLSDNFEKIFASIPQATLNKRFSQLFTEKIKKDGKALREKTPEGKFVYKRPPITKEQWVDYFTKQPEGSSDKSWGNTKSSRKGSLAQVLADEAGLDQIVQNIADPEIAKKFKEIQELSGKKLKPGFAKKVIQAIDRSIEELTKFQQENLMMDGGFVKALELTLKGIKKLLEAGVTLANAIKQAVNNLKNNTGFAKDIEKQTPLSKYDNQVYSEVLQPLQEELKNYIEEEKYSKAKQFIKKIDLEYKKKRKEYIDSAYSKYFVNAQKNIYNKLKTQDEKVRFLFNFDNLYYVLFKNRDGSPFNYNFNKTTKKGLTEYNNFIKQITNNEMEFVFKKNMKKDRVVIKFNNKNIPINPYNYKRSINMDGRDKYGRYFLNKLTPAQREERNNYEKEVIQNRKHFFELLDNLKENVTNNSKNENLKRDIYFVISTLGANMNGIAKRLYRIGDDPRIEELMDNEIEKNIKKGKKGYATMKAEHNPPSTWMLKNIATPYVFGAINKKEALDFYKKGRLNMIPESEDKKIVKANLQYTMPEGFDFRKDSPDMRYEEAQIGCKI